MAADKRADEAIEAFLEGPDVRRHRPTTRRRRRRPAAQAQSTAVQVTETQVPVMPRVSTDIRSLPGRIEWNAALERESLRAARYGRPAAVAIVELLTDRPSAPADPWMRTLAGAIATTLRGGCRATDLVARVATGRFQVLLPETPEQGAGRFAERISTACAESVDRAAAPITIRVSVASATTEHRLDEAVADALRSIEAA
jgi:diguanylate cyclase with GGDEF domain